MKKILSIIVAILALALTVSTPANAQSTNAPSTNAPSVTAPVASTSYSPLSVWLPPLATAAAQANFIVPFKASLSPYTTASLAIPTGQAVKVQMIIYYADGTSHYTEAYCLPSQLPVAPPAAFRK